MGIYKSSKLRNNYQIVINQLKNKVVTKFTPKCKQIKLEKLIALLKRTYIF